MSSSGFKWNWISWLLLFHNPGVGVIASSVCAPGLISIFIRGVCPIIIESNLILMFPGLEYMETLLEPWVANEFKLNNRIIIWKCQGIRKTFIQNNSNSLFDKPSILISVGLLYYYDRANPPEGKFYFRSNIFFVSI